jgi:hypothetical protein
MALFRKHIGKILLGLAAITWTSCGDDSSTGTGTDTGDDATTSSSSQDGLSSSSQDGSSSSNDPSGSNSKPESFTRNDFVNADSLITASKQFKATTEPCVTTKQYCQTIKGETSSGWRDADKLVTERAKTILDSPEAQYFPESRKSCLQNIKENFFFITHSETVYGISPCYNADDYIPGDSTFNSSTFPELFQKIDNAGACEDGVPNHVKVDATYLDAEKANADKYAKEFEDSLNKNLDKIEAECD